MIRKQKKPITMLVWGLVMIGLVAIVVSNSFIGLTISDLNQERQHLVQLDSQLEQTSQKVRRLNQLAQNRMHELLQLVPLKQVQSFPVEDFDLLKNGFEQTDKSPEMIAIVARMEDAVSELQRLWGKANAWRERQRQVTLDQQKKKTLSRVRRSLNQLRDGLEMLEGRQRLKEALLIRKWRNAGGRQAADHAETLLQNQSSVWKRVLAESKTELMDLARMVEALAGENEPRQLADLKDNQLKPNLERIEQLLTILYKEKLLDPLEMPPTLLKEIQEGLFGQGFEIYKEYQTIRPGNGGLYLLTRTRLELIQQREKLLLEIADAFQKLESIFPDLADLTRQRSRALAHQAAARLGQSSSSMMLLSIITLCGFLALGRLFANLARKHVSALEQRDKKLHELNRNLEEKVNERTALLEEKSLELIRAQEELLRHEKLAAIGSLASGVAHEINNPVAIIRGNVEVLQMKLRDKVADYDELDTITKQVERVSLITQNMLSFAGRNDLHREPVPLNVLIKDVLAQINHQVNLGSIQIESDLEPNLPDIPGDRERLRQVINNIILNALQSMEGVGVMNINSRLAGQMVEFTVSDTGSGIPENTLAKIFNPFFTTKKSGTGLGLAVSYGIVQAHEGSIDVESSLGKKTTFRIKLPYMKH